MRAGPAILLLVAAQLQAQDSSEWRWHSTLRAGQTIELKGVHGAIRAERAAGSEVEVVAVRRPGRRNRGNVNEVTLEVVPHTGGVTMCAMYPTPRWAFDPRNEWRGPNECMPGDSGRMNSDIDVQVEWMVRVPAGIGLSARTINGAIEAHALASDVEALTINGSVVISTTGWAEAATLNGNIDATLGNAEWHGALDYRTMNGDITVRLPAHANVDLHAESLSGGRVTADVPLELTTHLRRSRATGRMGRGGRDLYLGVTHGSVSILAGG
ncbi:MAG TPA: hypothetical protein VHE78_12000 [Gemmatimonadaceae bacterium]|nr:hypothetical protein [Gemmatimonadaceae bacterium]